MSVTAEDLGRLADEILALWCSDAGRLDDVRRFDLCLLAMDPESSHSGVSIYTDALRRVSPEDDARNAALWARTLAGTLSMILDRHPALREEILLRLTAQPAPPSWQRTQ